VNYLPTSLVFRRGDIAAGVMRDTTTAVGIIAAGHRGEWINPGGSTAPSITGEPAA
jgi:hypothetical protein